MNVRFEVSVNGKRVCVAGLPSCGVLGVNITSMERSPGQAAELKDHEPLEELVAPERKLTVMGLDSSDAGSGSIVRWLDDEGIDLNPGDEVVIKVLSAGESDPPDQVKNADFPPQSISKWIPPQGEAN